MWRSQAHRTTRRRGRDWCDPSCNSSFQMPNAGFVSCGAWRTTIRVWVPEIPASTPMKKRTKRGHGGQGADRSAAGESAWCGKQNDCRLTTTAAAEATSRQGEACPAAERSAPCPPCPRFVRFFMGVDAGISGTQTRMVVRHAPQLTNPALGIWKEELQDGSHQSRPRRLVVRCACDLHIVQIDA